MKVVTELVPVPDAPEHMEGRNPQMQDFLVEKEDVGQSMFNYRGHGYGGLTFTGYEVGREITVYSDNTGWTCWVFKGHALLRHSWPTTTMKKVA